MFTLALREPLLSPCGFINSVGVGGEAKTRDSETLIVPREVTVTSGWINILIAAIVQHLHQTLMDNRADTDPQEAELLGNLTVE